MDLFLPFFVIYIYLLLLFEIKSKNIFFSNPPLSFEITNWLTEIQSDIGLMAASESYFSHLAVTTKKKCAALPADEVDTFLRQHVDFSFITLMLSQIGINRKSFNCLFEPTTVKAYLNSYGVTNQVIVDLKQF